MEDENLKAIVTMMENMNAKSSIDEMAQCFEQIVLFVEQTKNLTEQEIEKIRNIYEDSSKKLDKKNLLEFEKIKKQISSLVSGKDGRDGRDGRDGLDGKDGMGIDGRDGEDGKDGSSDTPDQTLEKINSSKLQVKKERIEGLADIERMARANAQPALPVTTSFFNGLRAKNLNILAGSNMTVASSQSGDTVNVTVSSTASGGGGGLSIETVAGVDGSTTVFTVANTPLYIVVDNATYFNGFGYSLSGLTVTFDVPPQNFIRNIYGGVNIETPTGSNVTFTATQTPKFLVVDNYTLFQGFGFTLSGLTITLDVPVVNFIRNFY